MNIDKCRVAGEPWKAHTATGLGSVKFFTQGETPEIEKIPHDAGRWPANIILESSESVVGMFPNSKGARSQNNNSSVNIYKGNSLSCSKTELNGFREWYNDDGSAARFFHQVEPDGPRPSALIAYLHRLITPLGGTAYDPVGTLSSMLSKLQAP